MKSPSLLSISIFCLLTLTGYSVKAASPQPNYQDHAMVGLKNQAFWLYPVNNGAYLTKLAMKCASGDPALIPGTEASLLQWPYNRCYPVTLIYLQSKGLKDVPDNAFTGTNNRGVLCPEYYFNGLSTYHLSDNTATDEKCTDISKFFWFPTADGQQWYFACKP